MVFQGDEVLQFFHFLMNWVAKVHKKLVRCGNIALIFSKHIPKDIYRKMLPPKPVGHLHKEVLIYYRIWILIINICIFLSERWHYDSFPVYISSSSSIWIYITPFKYWNLNCFIQNRYSVARTHREL